MAEEDSTTCCGCHVVTCSKILAILGLVSAISSIRTVDTAWYAAPMTIIGLIAFSLAIYALWKEIPSYLKPVEYLLMVNIALNVAFSIYFIVLGIVLPEWLIKATKEATGGSTEDVKSAAQVSCITFGVVGIASQAFVAYIVSVFRRTRSYFLQIRRPVPQNII